MGNPINYEHNTKIPPIWMERAGAGQSELLARLSGASVQDVSDAVGPLYTMLPSIRPLYEPIATVFGFAVTAKAVPGDNLAVHGALATAGEGDVVVVDWHGYEDGCGAGSVMLETPRSRGLAGVVVDGGWRDVDELQDVGFPIFGLHKAALSPAKRNPGEINVPISCGGVVVCAGDVVAAGPEGVAIIPSAFLESVIVSLETRRRDEAVEAPGAHQATMVERANAYQAAFEAQGGIRVRAQA